VVTQLRASGGYDDVDSLVDAIVNSSKARSQPKPSTSDPFLDHTPMPIDEPTPSGAGHLSPTPLPPLIKTRPTPREMQATPPQVTKPKGSFSRAIDEANSQGDIDALVDAIVHASALAKTPESGSPQPSKAPDFTPQPVRSTGDVVGQETFGFRMGQVINGRYRVIEKLGSGGMAVVYKVEHTLLEKSMALKLLRPELSTVPYVVQRFQREARFVSQLDDPRIVRVTDFGRAENGSLFLVMELIEGDSLSRRLESVGLLPLQLSLHIAEQVLLALDHAHRQNVIHRDLKPDNIMLLEKEGRTMVKIVDFGIAKLASESPVGGKPLTQAGMVFGSPRYMSPEQASGETVDHRSDLYAVGVMLYEMLSGKRPFDGTSARAILSAVLMQQPPPLELKLEDKTRAQAIERVIMRALSKDREERFPSAMAFWESLRATM
jgi:tRNA A-37 threonylcarbamoyl transferase component Bud32